MPFKYYGGVHPDYAKTASKTPVRTISPPPVVVLPMIQQIGAPNRPVVKVGDTVRVHVKVKEGARERVQVFEGTVIAKKHGGIEETFTVRRISYGVGVEKVFPVHSPSIVKVETVRHGYVRRAKLYYLRDRVGKAAKVREKL